MGKAWQKVKDAVSDRKGRKKAVADVASKVRSSKDSKVGKIMKDMKARKEAASGK